MHCTKIGRAVAWVGALLSTLIIAQPPANAASSKFGLRLDLRGVAADEVALIQRYLYTAETLLPPRVKQRLPFPVRVQFMALDRHATLQSPPCKPLPSGSVVRQLLAVTSSAGGERSVILLHTALKSVVVAGPERSPAYECGHRSFYKLALATLLHEIMHVFDQRTQLSQDRRYWNLHRFTRQGLLRRLRSRNELSLRSPDPYELFDIHENLAVHAEYFLLDPEYRCRRPASYQFLESALGYRPFPHAACEVNLNVSVAGRSVRLDPDRIYQIHFLLAGPGTHAQSRFGHAMYRIVLCAPQRPRADARCLEDLQHHLVLSFAANLRGDPRISIWRGLNGGYASQVSIVPLGEVLSKYSELEFRDLESLPLRLTNDEKARFIFRALEVYWGYAGRYYFLTNNCLSEAKSLLQAVSPSARNINSATPIGFYRELVKADLGDDVVFRDRARAERQGYLFRGLLDAYQQRIDALRAYLAAPAPRRLARFLDTGALKRRSWFAPALRDRIAVAHFYALENMVLRQRSQELESKLIRFCFRVEREPRYAALRQFVGELLAQSNQSEPWQRAWAGYGIPSRNEMVTTDGKTEERATQALLPKAMSALRNEFPRELRELEEVQRNRELLRSALLRLTAESAAAETVPGRPADPVLQSKLAAVP